jgi:hypothetical protein
MNKDVNTNNQDYRVMSQIDRAYGEVSNKKKIVMKDKSTKHRNNFTKMNVNDILAMEEDGNYEYNDGYEVH